MKWMDLFGVAVGGAVGASLRFAVNQCFLRSDGTGQPWATFTVNVVGCLLAGVLLVWLETRAAAPWVRSLLMVGFLGGLTTFSALGIESFQWLRMGRVEWFVITVLAHVVCGVLAVALGWKLARVCLA